MERFVVRPSNGAAASIKTPRRNQVNHDATAAIKRVSRRHVRRY